MNLEALLERGIIAYREGKFEDAIKDLEKLKEQSPPPINGLFYLGNAYAKVGRHQEAINTFKLICTLHPDISNVHSNMGNSYIALRDYTSAVIEFEKAIRLNPDDSVAVRNLPIAKMFKDRIDSGGKITYI